MLGVGFSIFFLNEDENNEKRIFDIKDRVFKFVLEMLCLF